MGSSQIGGVGSKNGSRESCGGGASSTFAFFLFSFVVLGSIGGLYARFMVAANVRGAAHGCEEDNEGSWAIGVYYGDSPFSLKPIEEVCFFSFYFIFWFSRLFFYYYVYVVGSLEFSVVTLLKCFLAFEVVEF